jgi:predicted DNA-binding antitoxin AbrB/MazE fold protein
MAEMRFKGVVRNGVIVPIEKVSLPEGAVADVVIA